LNVAFTAEDLVWTAGETKSFRVVLPLSMAARIEFGAPQSGTTLSIRQITFHNANGASLVDGRAGTFGTDYASFEIEQIDIDMDPDMDFPPHTVNVMSTDMFPEGITYDSVADEFLMGSLSMGVVTRIDPLTGEQKGVIMGGDLNAFMSLGLFIDEAAYPRRLYVCASNGALFLGQNPTVHAKLFRFNLETYALDWSVDLTRLGSPAEFNLANDATVDAMGNIYVTDSFMGQIWKITPAGVPSIFVQSAMFAAEPNIPVSINGIKTITGSDGKQFLIVNKTGLGRLYKVTIPMDASAPVVTEVTIRDQTSAIAYLTGADGMIVHPNGVVVSCGEPGVFSFFSNDNFATATIDDMVVPATPGVSTCAFGKNQNVFVTHGYGSLFGYYHSNIWPIEYINIDVDKNSDFYPHDLNVVEYDLFPEGIAYDYVRNQFVLSSLAMGDVRLVDVETGDIVTTSTADDLSDYMSAGLFFDESRVDEPRRLLVCATDAAVFAGENPYTQALLFSLDADDYSRQWVANLTKLGGASERNLANDVTTDKDGNAYVTDSFNPHIWKVTPDGEASIFVESTLFEPDTPPIGLNGIKTITRADGTQFLIVNKSGLGTLYKVTIPQDMSEPVVTEVAIFDTNGQPAYVDLADGMIVTRQGMLVVSGAAYIFSLYTVDDWATAYINDKKMPMSMSVSTVTMGPGDSIYVLDAHVGEFGWADVANYTVEYVPLDISPPSCTNGMMDGMEMDVDCGGLECDACPDYDGSSSSGSDSDNDGSSGSDTDGDMDTDTDTYTDEDTDRDANVASALSVPLASVLAAVTLLFA